MIPYTKLNCGIIAVALLTVLQAAAATDTPAPLVVTTASGERFIGTPGSEEAGYLRLVSMTLGEIRIPRDKIRSVSHDSVAPSPAAPTPAPVAEAGPPPAPKKGFIQSRLNLPGTFNATAGVGITAQSGMLEQQTLSGSVDASWEIGKNVFQTSLMANRQSVHGVVYNDSLHWDVQYQRNMTQRLFWMAANFYREDSAMAVDREEVVFAGLGFNFLKTPVTEVVTVIGPSYIWQEYLPPAPGLPPPPSFGDPAGVLYQSVSYTALPRMRISASVLAAQSLEYGSKHLARLILSLDYSLTENLILSNSYFWMRDGLQLNADEKHQGMLTTQLKLRL